MFAVTPPLVVSKDDVWVLVSAPTGAVDAARMAYNPDSGQFIALPCQAMDTTALIPTTCHGEPVTGFRWATCWDIADHDHLFTTH